MNQKIFYILTIFLILIFSSCASTFTYKHDPRHFGHYAALYEGSINNAIANNDSNECNNLPEHIEFIKYPDMNPDEISTMNMVAECVQVYFFKTKDQKACDRLAELIGSNRCYEHIAIEKNDLSYCDKITVTNGNDYWNPLKSVPYDAPHTRALCKVNLSKSLEYCSSFTRKNDFDFRNTCIYIVATAKQDFNLCYDSERYPFDKKDTAEHPFHVKGCIAEIAVETENIELCKRIDSTYGFQADITRNQCFLGIASKMRARHEDWKELCDFMVKNGEHEHLKNNCYEGVF